MPPRRVRAPSKENVDRMIAAFGRLNHRRPETASGIWLERRNYVGGYRYRRDESVIPITENSPLFDLIRWMRGKELKGMFIPAGILDDKFNGSLRQALLSLNQVYGLMKQSLREASLSGEDSRFIAVKTGSVVCQILAADKANDKISIEAIRLTTLERAQALGDTIVELGS